MSTHLATHFKEQRLAHGLRVPDLARLVDYRNISKGSSRIHEFERCGHISPELLSKLTAALGIDPATVERLAALDHHDFIRDWLEFVNTPVVPYLVIRLIPAIYTHKNLPDNIPTRAEAETWASSVAKRSRKRCCLVWSRKISCWFLEDGSLSHRSKARPGIENSPYMMLGGKGRRFLFGSDLAEIKMLQLQRQHK